MPEDTRKMLLAAGWEERFTASGARLAEMAEYYRELGFEVRVEQAVEPSGGEASEGEICATCMGTVGADGPVGVVYTRLPFDGPTVVEEGREE